MATFPLELDAAREFLLAWIALPSFVVSSKETDICSLLSDPAGRQTVDEPMLTYLGQVRKYWMRWMDVQLADNDLPAAVATAQKLASRQALEHVAGVVSS